MKTVFNSFCEFYRSYPLETEDETVFSGIKSYLSSIGLDRSPESASEVDRIAKRELSRFKLMTQSAFESYFRYFSIREEIIALLKQSEYMVDNREKNDNFINESDYSYSMSTLYKLGTSLTDDQAHLRWFDKIAGQIRNNLRYALGHSELRPKPDP